MRETDRAHLKTKRKRIGISPRSMVSGAFAMALFLAPALMLCAQDAAQSGGQSGTQSGGQVSSQTGSGEITIEELFLKSIEFQIIREKAVTDDREMKLSALD